MTTVLFVSAIDWQEVLYSKLPQKPSDRDMFSSCFCRPAREAGVAQRVLSQLGSHIHPQGDLRPASPYWGMEGKHLPAWGLSMGMSLIHTGLETGGQL